MATRSDARLTYDDYVTFPDDERWELIDGVAYMVPAPNTRHQTILAELSRQVLNHVKSRGGGRAFFAPFDVVLDPGDVLQPDLVFIADEDMDVLTPANVWGSPTWVVEILSKDTKRDRVLKLARYERFGVKEFWIVDPANETVEIYRLDEQRYGTPATHWAPEVVSPLSPPGLEVALAELFSA